MKNKRGAMELAISTIVILVIALFFLAGMIYFVTVNWDKFSNSIKGFLGSDTQNAIDICETQCDLSRDFDFCCVTKKVDKVEKTCEDLNVSCNVDCRTMC